jgi:4-amino-4-deoxychorismate lyase
MCLCVESLKIQNRTPGNVDYHSARMNRTRYELFGIINQVDLRNILQIPPDLTEAVYKCRVIYGAEIEKQEYLPYTARRVKTLCLVDDDEVDYAHKYVDRFRIDSLREASGADDILIVKHGHITDASSSNVVFFDGSKWLTPASPLLKGTKRQQLLEKGIIREEEIMPDDLKRFQKCILINAMLELDENRAVDVRNIYWKK